MAKGAYVGVSEVARKIKKGYIGVNGIARKLKKAYIGVDGVARLCWGGVADMEIASSGNMTDYGLVVMGDGNQYRLVAITGSGTVTFGETVTGEVWMCGGGTSGNFINARNTSAGGGAGAFTATGEMQLSGDMVAVVGAGGSAKNDVSGIGNFGGYSSFGGLQTSVNFSRSSGTTNNEPAAIQGGLNGGTGGGGSRSIAGGSGDGLTKYPFGDSTYFSDRCHCAGGGGGGYRASKLSNSYSGGNGGTNGGNGSVGTSGDYTAGSGGSYGGGQGGYPSTSGDNNNGKSATFYGGGGGGNASNVSAEYWGTTSGAGYQGIIYIRIPVNQ